MSCYFIANIKLKDQVTYNKYLEQCDEIFKKFNGKYLAVNEKPEIVEGLFDYSKVVLIEFKNKSEFKKWYYSDEYQKILKFRLEGAECDTMVIHGK